MDVAYLKESVARVRQALEQPGAAGESA